MTYMEMIDELKSDNMIDFFVEDLLLDIQNGVDEIHRYRKDELPNLLQMLIACQKLPEDVWSVRNVVEYFLGVESLETYIEEWRRSFEEATREEN